MNVKCKLEDRKELVKALERRLDLKAKYLGAPSFIYEIGDYRVEKDGTLTAPDEKLDQELMKELCMKGFIEEPHLKEGVTAIALPMEMLDGLTLMNMVFRINSKDELLSKACGKKGAFRINQEFIRELDKVRPKSTEDFMKVLGDCGGNDKNTGITFTKDKLIISFPYMENPGVIAAYTQLVEKMQNEAALKKRIRPDRIGLPENEKYSFRNWLVTLGMMGDEFKEVRAILLRNLTGHIAFRTKQQAEVAQEKLTEARKEKKCSGFQVL